jgi:hypothetical protein
MRQSLGAVLAAILTSVIVVSSLVGLPGFSNIEVKVEKQAKVMEGLVSSLPPLRAAPTPFSAALPCPGRAAIRARYEAEIRIGGNVEKHMPVLFPWHQASRTLLSLACTLCIAHGRLHAQHLMVRRWASGGGWAGGGGAARWVAGIGRAVGEGVGSSLVGWMLRSAVGCCTGARSEMPWS